MGFHECGSQFKLKCPAQFVLENMIIHLYFLSFLEISWIAGPYNPTLWKPRTRFILHSQSHDWWWRRKARGQDISSNVLMILFSRNVPVEAVLTNPMPIYQARNINAPTCRWMNLYVNNSFGFRWPISLMMSFVFTYHYFQPTQLVSNCSITSVEFDSQNT